MVPKITPMPVRRSGVEEARSTSTAAATAESRSMLTFARPKSMSLTRSPWPSATITLRGFTSRWTMCIACVASSAAAS